jgi:hypothetical protein
MKMEINYAAVRSHIASIVGAMVESVDQGIDEGRPYVHVDTGRLQASLRRDEPESQGQEVVVNVIAGGIRMRGIFREQTIQRDVSYAIFEETRHPQIRSFTVPAVLRAVRRIRVS